MDADKNVQEASSWWRRILIGRRPKRTLARIITLVIVCFIVFKFLFLPIRVTGISMEPTYRDGRVNLVNRLAYARSRPKRGDVVGIRTLAGERLMYMKRVIGLPGERIAIRRGVVYINGQKLDEPYVKAPRSRWNEEVQLNEHQYFVIGDNREMPKEWHLHGEVDESRIVGKVLF